MEATSLRNGGTPNWELWSNTRTYSPKLTKLPKDGAEPARMEAYTALHQFKTEACRDLHQI